jgi:hypothetical protein
MESVSILANVSVIRESTALVMLPAGVAAHYEALGLVRRLRLTLEAVLPPVSVIHRQGEAPGAALDAAMRAALAVAGKGRAAPA